MLFKSLLRILKSYRFSLIKIIFFELIYLIKGFKGNRFTFSKNEMADNIPCPYYFLYKIKKFLADKKKFGYGSGLRKASKSKFASVRLKTYLNVK